MAAPTVDDLVQALVELYRSLQTRLTADVARALSSGIDDPDWTVTKLAAVTQLRRRTEQVLARMQATSDLQVQQAILLAVQRGSAQAEAELEKLAGIQPPPIPSLTGSAAVTAMTRELALLLRSTHTQILRWTLDTYRTVVAETGLAATLTGVRTRRQAAQDVWERFLDRGITGFVDKAGRHWELASYVEMAVRTGTQAAMTQAHVDRLRDAGRDLVVVSDSPRECGLCRPWEGQVLLLSGTGEAPSLVAARAAGLFHPNCTHSISLYIPGITPIHRAVSDSAGDEAKQRQRVIERHIRKWKRRSSAAIDPVAVRAAKRKVQQWQAGLRAHIAEHNLKRLSYREQIGKAR